MSEWNTNNGVQPVADDVVVEVVLGGGGIRVGEARSFMWVQSADWICSSDYDVFLWRLASDE